MIKALLGPGNFRKGMDLYFTRHDGEAATIEQFVQCFADVSGADLTQFMLWYSQAGTSSSYRSCASRSARHDLPTLLSPTSTIFALTYRGEMSIAVRVLAFHGNIRMTISGSPSLVLPSTSIVMAAAWKETRRTV